MVSESHMARWLIAGVLCSVLWASGGAVVTSCAQDGGGEPARVRAQSPYRVPWPDRQDRQATSGGFVRDYEEVAPSVGATSEPAGWQVGLGVIGSLALVVVAIYGTLWGIKVFLLGKGSVRSRAGLIRIWESTHLSPNRTLHLVEVGERLLLLGATDSQVNLLAELDRDAIEELVPDKVKEPFATRLAQAITQEPVSPMIQRDMGSVLTELRMAIHRLRDAHRTEEP